MGTLNSLVGFAHPHFDGSPSKYYPQHLNHDLLIVPDPKSDGVNVYLGERIALEKSMSEKGSKFIGAVLLLLALLTLVVAALLGKF